MQTFEMLPWYFFLVAFMLPYESYRVQKCFSAQRIVLLVQPQSEENQQDYRAIELVSQGISEF